MLFKYAKGATPLSPDETQLDTISSNHSETTR